MINLPKNVRLIFKAFEDQQVNLRLVGGPVRDLLLGVQPKDWDFCTPAEPQDTLWILRQAGYKPFDLSNGHGTVSVIIDNDTFEITTLRIDEETDGRHAKIQFTTDWEADAARRDFTINAMSMDVTGQIYDYFNGKRDLENQLVRFVGDPDIRIREDYLRILRYFRFYGRFSNQSVEYQHEGAIGAILTGSHGLRNISGERITSEMKRILTGPNVSNVVDLMDRLGILKILKMKR